MHVSLGPHGHVDGNFGAVQSQRHADAKTRPKTRPMSASRTFAPRGVGLAAFAPRGISRGSRVTPAATLRGTRRTISAGPARAPLSFARPRRVARAVPAPLRASPSSRDAPATDPASPGSLARHPAPALEADASPAPDPLPSPLADWFPAGLALGGAGLLGSGFQLDGPASTAQAIAVLASIIFVHECGHFFAARLQNIHVSKFSVGFGPNLLSYKGPEVEYSLRAIPLGGFVAFPDDDPDCPYPEDDPDLLRNRPILDRALVIGAGVAANVAFALAILLVQVNTVGLVEQSYKPGVRVSQLLSASAARDCGVLVGDVIVGVNGEEVSAGGRSVNRVVQTVKASGATPLRLSLLREGAPVNVDVTPNVSPAGEGRIGVQLEANAEMTKRVAKNAAEGASLAAKEFGRLAALVSKSLFSLVSDFESAKENVSGPIAIVGVGAEVMRTSDLSGLYQFASVININLAVVNILPLPALDGGFLFLIAVEALRGGKKLPTEVEQSITASGVLLLLGSGMFLILRDTLNLFAPR